MSIKDIKMYEELLELLDQRYDEGEIDKQSYYELKKRYMEKLEAAKRMFQTEKNLGNIKVSGFKTITEDEISIAGSTKIYGGQILRNIRIAGSGKVEGNIECLSFHSAGSVKISGDIISHNSIKAAGSFVCEGSVYANGDLKCSGSTKIEQEAVIKGKTIVSGSIKVEQSLKSEQGIKISGSLHIEGNLTSKGVIEIKGKSRIEGDIIGKSIFVSSRATAFESFFFKRRDRTKVEGNIIAEEEIDIQDIHVEGNVRGKIVKIGPNSKIEGNVYYVKELYVSDDIKLEGKAIQITNIVE